MRKSNSVTWRRAPRISAVITRYYLIESRDFCVAPFFSPMCSYNRTACGFAAPVCSQPTSCTMGIYCPQQVHYGMHWLIHMPLKWVTLQTRLLFPFWCLLSDM
jgi:hypothetical protein